MNGKLAFLAGNRHAEVAEFPLPDPEPGDLLLEVIQANVCGSDLGIWRGQHARLSMPVLGHEFVGRVTAHSSDTGHDSYGSVLRPGDRVVASYFPMCQQCAFCRNGQHGSCERAYAYRALKPADYPHFHGAFASHYYAHADQQVLRVPDGIPDAAAAFLNCGFATVVTALAALADGEGRSAMVIGGGGLGVASFDVLSQRGYQPTIVEVSPARVAALIAIGIPVLSADPPDIGEICRSVPSDVIVDVSGDPNALAVALDAVSMGGSVLEIGCVNTGPGLEVSIAPSAIVRRNATIQGTLRYSPPRLPEAAEYMARSAIDYGSVSDKHYGLTEVNLAMERAEAREVLRPVVVPS